MEQTKDQIQQTEGTQSNPMEISLHEYLKVHIYIYTYRLLFNYEYLNYDGKSFVSSLDIFS